MKDVLEFLVTPEGKWILGLAGGLFTALISKLTIRYFKDLKMDQKIFQADVKGTLNAQNSEFKSEFKIIHRDISDIKNNQNEMTKSIEEQKNDIKSIQVHVRSMETLRKTTERRKDQLNSTLEFWTEIEIDDFLKEFMMIYGNEFISYVMDSHTRINKDNFSQVTDKGKILVNSHYPRAVKIIGEDFAKKFFDINHKEANEYLNICREIVFVGDYNNKNIEAEIFKASVNFFSKILLKMNNIYSEVIKDGRSNNREKRSNSKK